MLPDIISQSCYQVCLQKEKWQQLQTILTAVMQQNWMHHVCCQTITFLADLWKRGDCSTDCSYTYRQKHLSLVTVTWLIKISDVALTVAYLFLICHRTGREGKEENYWLISRRGGTDPTYVLSLPFTASYISLYFCPLVMPVQL